MILIVIIFSLFFLIPFLCGLFGVKLPITSPQDETSETENMEDIHKQERIDIIDNALVQYVKLLDNLAEQYKTETDEKKRALILSKQIATLEKYNKALEKREKLE